LKKALRNYAGTIANPPLEDSFRQYAWQGLQQGTEAAAVA
jgi:hypothetical protein